MRKALLPIVLAILPGVGAAQFPGVDVTGSISASVGAPISCESCENLGFHNTVGVLIRNWLGIDYRGLRWGDQQLTSQSRMTTDMLALDVFLPTTGALRPFLSGGGGHSSVKLLNVFTGGHSHSNYGPASSLRTRFWGVGMDVRIYKRAGLTAMLSSLTADAANTPAEHCTQYNYLSGDFSWSCSSSSVQKYTITGLSLGLALR